MPANLTYLQTAITRLMGTGFGIVAAALICLVVAGSLLGNSLIISRMIVAAANKTWFPKVFSLVGYVGLPPKHDDQDSSRPSRDQKTRSDAPINALLLSVVLATLYILFGNFRALLTFTGLGEYTFFFLTVIGAIVLRFREPDLRRPYKPLIVIPILFAVVSGFVVIRGAAFAPVLAIVLLVLWLIGLLAYWAKRRWS